MHTPNTQQQFLIPSTKLRLICLNQQQGSGRLLRINGQERVNRTIMLVLIQSNQLEVVCFFKSFETGWMFDLYGIYYTEWVFMWQ